MKNDIKKNGSGYYDPTAFKAIINTGGGKYTKEIYSILKKVRQERNHQRS